MRAKDSRQSRTFPALWKGALILTLTGLLGSVASAQDEETDEYPRLLFKYDKPRTVVIYPGAEGGGTGEILSAGRIYWYVTYTLTNPSDREQSFFVTLTARSDKRRTYSDLALPQVEKKIEKLERRDLYSKVDLLSKGKRLDEYTKFAPGETKRCVAIFNPLDSEADKITIDVHGLSNDLKIEELGEGRFKVEEKVLRLRYERPGDELLVSLDRIVFRGKEWVNVTRESPPSKN